jgi:hypothetical protein
MRGKRGGEEEEEEEPMGMVQNERRRGREKENMEGRREGWKAKTDWTRTGGASPSAWSQAVRGAARAGAARTGCHDGHRLTNRRTTGRGQSS